jgi:tetratricopeptide (TPR) repeat protein
MSEDFLRYPLLELCYQQYLTDENSADFIRSVSTHYNIGTLERLARNGGRLSRRSAILAIGFLGEFHSNEVVGGALVDHDRAVRLLADHGIRQLWTRQGTISQRQTIQNIYRFNSQNRLDEAVDTATSLINVSPDIGEAWHQRAVAYCAEGEFEAAIEDCKETLNCNRFHFPAAMGLGHCCLQLDDVYSALDGFRLALKINPDLDGVRNHIKHLERMLKEG